MIKEYLKTAAKCYYAGSPIISDEVFDRLAENVGFNEVGAKQHENVKKHYKQMFSLQKHYDGDPDNACAKIVDKVFSPKLDGAAISLLYIDNELVQVLTRGDGIEGQDTTNKFLARKDLVPLLLRADHPGVLQITGEIVAPKVVPNSRNYAAGALNLKDVSEFCLRGISFFAYSVYPYLTDTYKMDMESLEVAGFETVFTPDLLEIYPCDGIVFRVNSNAIFDEMGYTAKHPRGAYAHKERAEAVETEILSVDWQVGKSGKVTPVANLKPVYIGDKLVSRATLNNQRFIEELDICIGDTVQIALAGLIIPQVLCKVEA